MGESLEEEMKGLRSRSVSHCFLVGNYSNSTVDKGESEWEFGEGEESSRAIVPHHPCLANHTHSRQVHHSNYLKYFERGREHLLDPNRLTELFKSSGRSFVVTNVDIKYENVSCHGDIIEVRTNPDILSPFRIAFTQTIYRCAANSEEVRDSNGDPGGKDERLVDGRVVMVCVDADMNLVKLPEFIFSDKRLSPVVTEKESSITAIRKKKILPRKKRPPSNCDKSIAMPAFDLDVFLHDTDFTGVCYYANYLRWMEMARAAFLGVDILASRRRGGAEGVGAAIYTANLEYKQGAMFGDRVRVRSRFVVDSKYRVTFHHEVVRLGRAGEEEGKGEGLLAEAVALSSPCCTPSTTRGRATLLVKGVVSIIFLSNGGSGTLVQIPDVFRQRLLHREAGIAGQ